MANLTSLDGVIRRLYVSPIGRVINQESLMVDTFKKRELSFNEGGIAVMTIQTSRNTAVGARAEGGPLPQIGVGGAVDAAYSTYTIRPAYLYSHFQISGPAEAATATNGRAVLNGLDESITNSKDALLNQINREFFSGQRVIGLIHQRRLASGAPDTVCQFAGDFTKAAAALAEGPNPQVVITRLGTFANIAGGGNLTLTAVSPAAKTITITDAGGAGFDTLTGVPEGTPFAVELVAGQAPNAGENNPYGILSGLFQRNVYGVDRTAAAAAELRGVAQTQNNVAAGPNNWDTLTVDRMQKTNALRNSFSGKPMNMVICGHLTLTEYADLGMQTATLQNDVTLNKMNAKMDLSFGNYAFGGAPMFASRHCPEGMMIGLSRDAWRYCALREPGVEDRDGRTIRYQGGAGGTDVFDGIVSGYINIIPEDPHANWVLTGINY